MWRRRTWLGARSLADVLQVGFDVVLHEDSVAVADREHDRAYSSAVRVIGGARLAPVCARDRLDDRQAAARPPPWARMSGAREALERLSDELGREARALVAHEQRDRVVCDRRSEVDVAVAVAQGV